MIEPLWLCLMVKLSELIIDTMPVINAMSKIPREILLMIEQWKWLQINEA